MSAAAAPAGHCSSRFRKVGERFRDNLETGRDVGASIALYVDGVLEVDLWGGHCDAARLRPWHADTLVNVWSTTKGVVAACFAIAHERGLCSYEDRVADHWPQFAAAGKGAITIAELLSHQAGLSAFSEAVRVEDFAEGAMLAERLASQAPLWEPGTRSGYHAITVGFLASELFRRIEGRSIAGFVGAELAEFDLHIGIDEQNAARVADILPSGLAPQGDAPELDEIQLATLGNPALVPEDANRDIWRSAEIPSANGFAHARGLAALYSSLLTGRPGARFALSSESLAAATKIRRAGPDAVLGLDANWASGFLRNSHGIYGPGAAAFGHSGWGGSFAFADPERGLAMAYTMNAMGTDLVGDPRAVALVSAVYEAF